jgi:hypothetical protein
LVQEKKVTLQDVSLSKKEGLWGKAKEFITESEVESEAESTTRDEAKPHDIHNKEAKGSLTQRHNVLQI